MPARFNIRLLRLCSRCRSEGVFRTGAYLLITVLLQRAGVHINEVFRAGQLPGIGATKGPLRASLEASMDFLTEKDRAALLRYGGNRLIEGFRGAFARGERCVVVRVEGGCLAGVCWLQRSASYLPAAGRRSIQIERCFTLPEYRGRGVFPLALAWAVARLMQEGEKAEDIYVACSVGNRSSARGICKAGFTRAGLLIELLRWERYWPGHSRMAAPPTRDWQEHGS